MTSQFIAIIHNTQLFVATHSEIIAAQFKPSERIRLQFEDDGSVTWRRGISPEGDDPNDLLLNDFAVRSLYGKAGIKQWRRFLQLRREILIEFLGWNEPTLAAYRAKTVARIKDLRNLFNDDAMFLAYITARPEYLSFISVLEVELGLPLR